MTNTTDPRMFTVSAFDALYGQRVNCGSYLTLAEAVAYVARSTDRKEWAHAIHENPLGYGMVDSPAVWQSLQRQRPEPKGGR